MAVEFHRELLDGQMAYAEALQQLSECQRGDQMLLMAFQGHRRSGW
ncbi:hypothetical protein [Streptomyces sp. NRRL S-378]|nr:hypothetical protein [Streptomyces sp. NRRL S-378]